MAAAMGRRPTKNLNLPPRLRVRERRGRTYYYYDHGGKPRKESPLGSDYTNAIRLWSELEGEQNKTGQILTFKNAADRYLREVLPTKAARTQKDNLVELGWLLKFFNDPPATFDSIKPIHIRQYLDWRGQTAKIRANREKALFSHIWNMARAWGITDRANPCAGIKGFSEAGRDIYIEDDVLAAVWDAADQALRDALDLAYLTGQRPADVLKMSQADIKCDVLELEQGKTGKKLRIEIVGHLADLLKRIAQRKDGHKIHSLALICTDAGRALSYEGLRARFDKARIVAAQNNPKLASAIEAFQFRDLRAKAGTDKAESGDMHQAQKQLGHTTITMTQHYVRDRRGDRVKPTK